MCPESSCPAVYAGLLGGSADLVRSSGKALVLGGDLSAIKLFVLGCLGGVLVAGAAALIMVIRMRRSGYDADDEVPDLRDYAAQAYADDEAAWASWRDNTGNVSDPSALWAINEQRANEQRAAERREADEAARGALPDFLSEATPRDATSVVRPDDEPTPVAAPSEQVQETRPVRRRPQHMRPAAAPAVTSAQSSTGAPQESAAAQSMPSAQARQPYAAAHAVSPAQASQVSAPAQSAPSAQAPQAYAAARPSLSARVPQVPQVSAVQPAPSVQQPAQPAQQPARYTAAQHTAATRAPKSHAASDYGDIAENYVRKHTLRERMAARAAGVASVLADRLGHDMFDDLPVIQRADGSVGDVGTSWWDNALDESVRRRSLFFEDTASREALSTQGTADLAATNVPATQADAPAHPAEVSGSLEMATRYQSFVNHSHGFTDTSGLTRAQLIARSVAEVDTGVFPEQRDASELDGDDLWDVALKAMGERIAAQQAMPLFADEVGGMESIDEPTGIEDPTSFIGFKRPAGHPEVVDNESYVDYLIGEEFSHNQSQVAKRSSRHYLKLIQGGSQKSRPLSVPPEKRAYVPKHFASSRAELLAKEA